jgi:hypothetical protein
MPSVFVFAFVLMPVRAVRGGHVHTRQPSTGIIRYGAANDGVAGLSRKGLEREKDDETRTEQLLHVASRNLGGIFARTGAQARKKRPERGLRGLRGSRQMSVFVPVIRVLVPIFRGVCHL